MQSVEYITILSISFKKKLSHSVDSIGQDHNSRKVYFCGQIYIGNHILTHPLQ